MKCYIFDIDGTLANASHRLHYIQQKPKNWDAFFAFMENDKPNMPVISLVWSLRECGHRIVFASGRPEKYRQITEAWLEKYKLFDRLIHGKLWLFMRPDGDRRDDDIVKREILGKIWNEGFEPVMAFDDRDRVVKMWRDNGVPCAQVAPGDF